MSKAWLIKVVNSGNVIFEDRIAYKTLPGNNKLKMVMKMLVAKSLSEEEIITNSQLLRVTYDVQNGLYSCGENPFVTAQKIDI